MTAEI